MTTMNIQLPSRFETIGKFVNRNEACYQLSPITFNYVEKFYTNENGCVDFDKFETVQELVEYMIDHPRITNYWHTTDELKKLDEIRYWLGNKIRVFSPVYQNGIIISDSSNNGYHRIPSSNSWPGYMELKHTMFRITFDSTMYDVVEFLRYHSGAPTIKRNLTEDDYKYTIRDAIRIYHNDVKLYNDIKLYNEHSYNGATLKQQEELNRQEELKQQKKMQRKVELELQERTRQEEVKRQKEMRQEEETQRKTELELQEIMRQEENDQLRNENDQLRNENDQLRNEIDRLRGKPPLTINASVPWYLQTQRPISTVFGQCSTQMPSVHTVSTVFGQSTTASSFM